MSRQKAVSLLLQLAVACYLAFSCISALISPDSWIATLPGFLRDHTYMFVLLKLWAVVLLFLAIWIISSKRIFFPSLVSTILFAIILVINISSSDYFFHDLALTCAAASLFIIHFPRYNDPRRSA